MEFIFIWAAAYSFANARGASSALSSQQPEDERITSYTYLKCEVNIYDT
jgi:hypothetical protein